VKRGEEHLKINPDITVGLFFSDFGDLKVCLAEIIA
jgi:hypothetical protein